MDQNTHDSVFNNETSQFLRIPLNRIGAVIGLKGSSKNQIEELTSTKIIIDSETGEVEIRPNKNLTDPIMLFKSRDMVKAIGRGFTADQALKLASDDMFLEIIPLKPIIGDKINHIKRVRSRLIGTKGRTRKALEELTKVNIMILGSTVSLIGTYENITTSKSSLMEIIKGAKIESVIGKLEDSKNKNKKSENILWKNEDEATENTEDEVIDPFQDYKEE